MAFQQVQDGQPISLRFKNVDIVSCNYKFPSYTRLSTSAREPGSPTLLFQRLQKVSGARAVSLR